MRIDFWDVVQVRECCRHPEVRGKIGHVNGIGEDDGEPLRSISVFFRDVEEVWCFNEEDLLPLGYKNEIALADHKKWFGSAPRLRVTPDGRIVE